MNIAVLAITRHGIVQAARCIATLKNTHPAPSLFVPEKFRTEAETLVSEAYPCHGYTGKTGEQIPLLFSNFDALICLISLGAVVRLIAPHLKNKDSDPAVLVVDEAGHFVIPLLSGHTGGANALAVQLAKQLDAQAVLTTASDTRQTLAVDLLGHEFGWDIEADHDTLVRASAAVVNDEPVAIVQEVGRTDWWHGHANGRCGPLPENLHVFGQIEQVATENFAAVLWIANRPLPAPLVEPLAGRCVKYRPPSTPSDAQKIALGIGCDRGTPATTIHACIADALTACGRNITEVAAVASIDLKADEAGLLAVAQSCGWKIHFYPASALAKVDVPHPSETVRQYTGTPSVAEAAALLAAGGAQDQLIVEKHKRRGADGRNATVSIARMKP